MPSLREFFDLEAGERLNRLEQLASVEEKPDGAELQRQARALRGAAQMAGREHAYRAALGMESALRSVAAHQLVWTQETRERIRRSIADLRRLVAIDDGDEAEACAAAVLERCLALGIESSEPAVAGTDESDAEAAARDAFRAFARVEVASIADTMDAAIDAFASNPMDREALKRVLRRQRALLGSARLEEISILGETLHAIEDLAAVIAKINVPVKHEWLDVFRMGRDVLRDVHGRLEESEEPRAVNALSRLRTLRDELLDRHGPAEAVSTAAQASNGLVQAMRAADAAVRVPAGPAEAGAASAGSDTAAASAGSDTAAARERSAVPDDHRAVLRRALELRDRIEAAVRHDPSAKQAVDEVFDLIRTALE